MRVVLIEIITTVAETVMLAILDILSAVEAFCVTKLPKDKLSTASGNAISSIIMMM